MCASEKLSVYSGGLLAQDHPTQIQIQTLYSLYSTFCVSKPGPLGVFVLEDPISELTAFRVSCVKTLPIL